MSNNKQVQAAPEAVAVGDGSPFDLAMRAYEAAAYQHGRTGENALEVNAAGQRVYDLYASLNPQPVVDDAMVERALNAYIYFPIDPQEPQLFLNRMRAALEAAGRS